VDLEMVQNVTAHIACRWAYILSGSTGFKWLGTVYVSVLMSYQQFCYRCCRCLQHNNFISSNSCDSSFFDRFINSFVSVAVIVCSI